MRGKPIIDMAAYKIQLSARLDPIVGTLQRIFERVRRDAEARGLRRGRGGADDPRRGQLRRTTSSASDPDRARGDRARALPTAPASTSATASRSTTRRLSQRERDYTDFLYARLQRKGYLYRDCQRLVNNDRNVFRRLHGGARPRRRHGHGRHPQLLDGARRCAARCSTRSPATASSACRSSSPADARCFVADTAVHDMPTAEELADIAVEAAGVAARFGYDAARGDARLFDLRPARRASVPSASARRSRSSTSAPSISSMTARWPPMSRSTAGDGGLSVLPADGTGECAHHAGLPLGVDLDQDAAGARRRRR